MATASAGTAIHQSQQQASAKQFHQALPSTSRVHQTSFTRVQDETNVRMNFNLAPGWKRLLANGEIIYLSPTGAALRNLMQVKDYLLSTGTCKCGLPCPIRPELFFNFSAQASTVPMPEQSSNGSSNIPCCSHQKKILPSQPQIHLRGTSNVLQSQIASTSIVTTKCEDERVPPLPETFLSANTLINPNEMVQKVKVLKKRPSFKEDPTGYLNHQTAILHSSISTLHSPPDVQKKTEIIYTQASESPKALGTEEIIANCDMRQIKAQIHHQIEQRNRLIRQNQAIAASRSSAESPVSSTSSAMIISSRKTSPEVRSASNTPPDPRGPVQGHGITTTDSPSPAPSPETQKFCIPARNIHGSLIPGGQAIIKNTITSVVAGNSGKTITSTTTATTGHHFSEDSTQIYRRPLVKPPTVVTNIHQGPPPPVMFSPGSQVVVMPTSVASKTTTQNQIVISETPNMVISPIQHQSGHQTFTVINNGDQHSPNRPLIIQNSNILPQQNFLQSPTGGGIISPGIIQQVPAQCPPKPVQVIHQGQNTQFLSQGQVVLNHPGIMIPQMDDKKKMTRKRKPEVVNLSPIQTSPIQVSPNVSQAGQPQNTILQMAPGNFQGAQGFQLSPGIQGLTIVPKSQASPQQPQQQQQILLQNGTHSLIQPLGLLGQQLLVPAGLVMTPETTLVQIQNINPCGNLITPQGMVIRAQSPQQPQKQFLSPNPQGGQQYIVSGNGQISPIGQIYNSPVGLMQVPHTQASPFGSGHTQNSISIQPQTTIISSPQTAQDFLNAGHSVSTQTAQNQNNSQQVSILPPDTTTHSPQSPDRPSSARSGASYEGMAMVQCVSSSEPDSVVSPVADSANSPTQTNIEYIESGGIHYQTFKSSDSKIRRIQVPQHYTSHIMNHNNNTPDSHELTPTTSPVKDSPVKQQFSVGDLVWGPAKGYPAWPGKVVVPPEGGSNPENCVWVRWFGGRPNIEMVSIAGLKTLSEGLEAHHSALKDTRKGRKLNSYLERAIQEAMADLDRATAVSTSTNAHKGRGRGVKGTPNSQRKTPIKIAPAPSSTQQ